MVCSLLVRVLLVSQYFFPEVGATQTRMYEFATALTSLGHQVDVLTEFPNHPTGIIPPEYRGRWFEEDRAHAFRIVRVWVATSPRKTFWSRLRFYGSFLVMAVLGSLRLPSRYDAVVATSPPLPVAVAGVAIARLKRAAFVMDVRDLWPKAARALGELSNARLYATAEAVELWLYRKAERITATTQAFCRDIAGRGIAADKIVHVPNGTLPDIFTPDRGDAGLRRRLGLEHQFVVAYVGLHGIAQGLDTVLDAAERLKERTDIEFLFVGEGPQKAMLVAEASRRKLDRVRFLSQVPLEESAYYLNASDAVLVPLAAHPVFEMFVPSKLFDAMACARPVLLSVDGEAREILEAAGAGLFVEPDRPDRLAATIEYLHAHSQLRREMGERGRRFVIEHYVRPVQARRFAEIVCAAAATRGAR